MLHNKYKFSKCCAPLAGYNVVNVKKSVGSIDN